MGSRWSSSSRALSSMSAGSPSSSNSNSELGADDEALLPMKGGCQDRMQGVRHDEQADGRQDTYRRQTH